MNHDELKSHMLRAGITYVKATMDFEALRKHHGRALTKTDAWFFSRFQPDTRPLLVCRSEERRHILALRRMGLLKFKDLARRTVYLNPVTITDAGLGHIRRMMERTFDWMDYIDMFIKRENLSCLFHKIWHTNMPEPKLPHWFLWALRDQPIRGVLCPGAHVRYWVLHNQYAAYSAWYNKDELLMHLTPQGDDLLQSLLPSLRLNDRFVEVVDKTPVESVDWTDGDALEEFLRKGLEIYVK